MTEQHRTYRTTYLRWGHNQNDGAQDPLLPDDSGSWTLENYTTTLLTTDDGGWPVVLHSYVWSQPADDKIRVVVSDKYAGIDINARLAQLDGLQARNEQLMETKKFQAEANETLQTSLKVALRRAEKAEEAARRLGEFETLYRGAQAELLDYAKIEAQHKSTIEALEAELNGFVHNPLRHIKLGPTNGNNAMINAVLHRVWGNGLVSASVGKVEFVAKFYGSNLDEAAKVAETFGSVTDTRWNGSDRIRFLEQKLRLAEQQAEHYKQDAEKLRTALDNLGNTLKNAKES